MLPLLRSSIAALACTLVLGCMPGPTTNPNATPEGSVKSGSPANLSSSLAGTLTGFGGDNARFKGSDAAKISIVAQDEHGQTIPGTTATNPDGGGSFVIKGMPSGAYLVVATLPDGSTNWSLLATDKPTNNLISPGTTLAIVWAKDQLAGKLIFVGDLPYNDLLLLGTHFDVALANANATLAASDDDRFKQMTTLAQGDKGITSELAQLDQLLSDRAKANALKVPAYTTQREYDAKKKKLGLT